MLINELGEFGLIKRIRKSIKTDSSVVVGSGDDCAVLKFDKLNYQLFTCDMLVEGVDFTKASDPLLVGRKALAVSISDIASCAGYPRHAVVSLGLPQETSVERIDKITKGMVSLAKEYKINIVGGDISRSQKLVIDICLLGIVEKKMLVLRNGAKEGDIILVSGTLGGSIKGKHLNFIPRVKEARFLAKNFKISSMIDISDGLLQDLGHILDSSGVGAEIYGSLVPVSVSAKSLCDALTNGEDFELLFTTSPRSAERLLKRCPHDYRPIGRIMNKKYGMKLISDDGTLINLSAKGYRHF